MNMRRHYDEARMRLHDYLQRIGVATAAGRALEPTADTLRRLHAAHREAFLFENLSIQTGGRVSVSVEDIERKFLDDRRGGYCFEHNTLFGAALADLGFNPTTFLGRVRRGPPERWARTHMVLHVVVAGEPWLADVGFGGMGLLEPLPFREGATAQQVGLTYTLRRDDRLWVLSMRDAGGSTMDLYEFSEDAQTPGDVEVANHYTSTHPNSIFRRTLAIQRTTRNDRTLLRHDALTRYRDGRLEEQPIDRARLPSIARDEFGVELPAGPFVFDTA